MSLKRAIKSKKAKQVAAIVKTMPISEIADKLEVLENSERLDFFRLLDKETGADIFLKLDDPYQEKVILGFEDDEIINLFIETYRDDVADILEILPKHHAKRILELLPKDLKSDVKKILRYDEDTAAAIMNVDHVQFKQTNTLGDIRKEVRKNKDNKYISHYIFITDNKGRSVGFITLEDLIFEDSNSQAKKFLKPTATISSKLSKAEAAEIFADNDMSSLPVINNKKEIVGVMTADDVIDIVQEEQRKNINVMAGIVEDEVKAQIGYSKTPILSLFKSRIFWLLMLLVPATVTHFALDSFQEWFEHSDAILAVVSTAVIASIPLIMDTAGNAGSQSSATIIRSLATGDLKIKDYKKVFRKEIGVAAITGVVLAIVNFARLLIMFAITEEHRLVYGQMAWTAFAVSLALFIILIFAKTIGGLLPLIAMKLKKDPAVMASPLLTTIIDTLAIVILFGITYFVMILV